MNYIKCIIILYNDYGEKERDKEAFLDRRIDSKERVTV